MGVSNVLKKPMTQNFAALVLLQGVNYILPLLTFPFLVRVLGIERYGLVSISYNLIQYFVLFTDFGFNLSATKYISTHRNDEILINRYLNSAFVCRILLGITSFIILSLIILLFDKFNQESRFYFSFFGIVIGNIMFPMWFFQGMEKMKYITLFNIIAKLVSFVPFFIFIRKPEDYVLVPVFYTIGYVFAGLISIYIIYYKEKMKWFLPTIKEIKFAFSDSSTYFLSRLSLSIYTYSNTLLLGLVCGNTAAGYYSAAEKLFQAYNWMLTPLTGVLFPHMANKKDVPFFKKILKAVLPVNVLLLTGILFFSSYIILLVYGSENSYEILHVFRILMIASFFSIPSVLIGYPFLAALGHASYTNWTMVIVSIVHIIGLTALYCFGYISIYSIAVLVVFAEFLLFAIRINGVRKFKLFTYGQN